MKNDILDKTKRFISMSTLKIKKHSPEILLVTGIAGGIVATVLACKKTLEVNDILEEKNENIDKVHQCLEDKNIEYDQQAASKDLTLIYAQTGIKLFKLYSAPILLGTVSIISIVSGHKILRKRNIALVSAYMAIDKSFKKYRTNVVERFGEAVDKEISHGVKYKEVEEVDEKGKKVKKTIPVVDEEATKYSIYSKFFDRMCSQWTKDAEANLMFLRCQQNYANDVLKQRGYLFLNEVYDMLDIPRTTAGQIVGWIYDPKNGDKDNYVDFGIYRNQEQNRDFVNGWEREILLDFNVDGEIYKLIENL